MYIKTHKHKKKPHVKLTQKYGKKVGHVVYFEKQRMTADLSTILKKHKQYPMYKNNYKLNVNNIRNIVKKLKPNIEVLNNLPRNYILKGTPSTFKNTGKYYIIKSNWSANIELNSLTDYFTESCRIECSFKNMLSPIDYWKKNYKDIIKSLYKQNIGITLHNLREQMYMRNKPCNNFRISVCLDVLNLFKPTKWLDISAGWGDRLISALLYPTVKYYCGVDPNPCLHTYYKNIIKKFNTNTNTNSTAKECILIQDGFEAAQLPDVKFDLVFSSPPFFDLETYSSANANSYVKYSSKDSWFEGFLMPSLYKSVSMLEKGGYLVLYMDESKQTHYIPKMIELMNQRMQNAGMFYYVDSNKLRNFYCWQKP